MFLFRTNLEVEEKYDEYIDSTNSSKNSEDAVNWLQFYIGEMNDFVDVGFREVRKDKVEYVKASFLSVLQSIISGITNPLAIKAEIEVIEVQIKLAQTFCLLEEELLDSINDNNYQEILKLGSFCYSTYVDLEQGMILSQDAIYYNIDAGLEREYHPSMVSPIIDSSFLVQEFFKNKISEIKNAEVVEKVKKM